MLYKYDSPLELWKELQYLMFKIKPNSELYNIVLSCLWSNFDLDYSDIGYKREGNKLKRLSETYLIPGEIEKFNRKRLEVVRKKKDYVLLFRFGNKEKKGTAVGDFCLVASSFVFVNGRLTKITVFYRTTECTTKFLADLIFLRDVFSSVLFLDMEKVDVTFFFTKVYSKYLHFLNFVRILKNKWGEDPCTWVPWGKDFIEKMKKSNPKYKSTQRMLKGFLNGEKQA